MRFCPRCHKMMIMQNDHGLNVVRCDCGYYSYDSHDTTTSEKILKKQEVAKGVFSPEKYQEEGFPHPCKKCGFDYAEVVDLGAPYSDESNIYLFKCKKCGYIERQHDGTGNG